MHRIDGIIIKKSPRKVELRHKWVSLTSSYPWLNGQQSHVVLEPDLNPIGKFGQS